MKVPLLIPSTGAEEAQATRRVLESGWLTQGPEVAAFEREFTQYVGSEHACAVSSCTTALHLALLAVGVTAGDEVVTVSHSFIATANAIRYCGAVPVFVDIEGSSYNMDPALLETAISGKTKAILCVHQLGTPCDMNSIVSISRRHGIPVIEDAACAVGSALKDADGHERIGRPHGEIACFSFHPRKVMTTGDGGMLTTNSADHDRLFRFLRQHGMSESDQARHASSSVTFESYPLLGFNYRMTDIQAAVGRAQLKKLPTFVQARRELANAYRLKLEKIPGLTLPREPTWAVSNWQSYCVVMPDGADQLIVMQRMLDAQIATRRGVMNSHQERAYGPGTWKCGVCGSMTGCLKHFPNSELVRSRGLMLPIYPSMTVEQQDYVVEQLAAALDS